MMDNETQANFVSKSDFYSIVSSIFCIMFCTHLSSILANDWFSIFVMIILLLIQIVFLVLMFKEKDKLKKKESL